MATNCCSLYHGQRKLLQHRRGAKIAVFTVPPERGARMKTYQNPVSHESERSVRIMPTDLSTSLPCASMHERNLVDVSRPQSAPISWMTAVTAKLDYFMERVSKKFWNYTSGWYAGHEKCAE